MLSRFFQESDHLLALYAREPLEELLDRIARFQMIKQTFHRHARPSENRLTAENLRVLRYDAAHADQNTLPSFAAKSCFYIKHQTSNIKHQTSNIPVFQRSTLNNSLSTIYHKPLTMHEVNCCSGRRARHAEALAKAGRLQTTVAASLPATPKLRRRRTRRSLRNSVKERGSNGALVSPGTWAKSLRLLGTWTKSLCPILPSRKRASAGKREADIAPTIEC